VNVRLRESEDKAKFGELIFQAEEAKVVHVDLGELVGSMIQSERKHFDFGPLDVLREIGTGAFNAHPGLFAWNNAGRVFNSVEDAVSDFMNYVVDGNGSAGILEAMAAMIAGGGRKESAVGRQDIEADKAAFFNNGNQGMMDCLIPGFTEPFTEVGEGCLARNAIRTDAGKPPVNLSTKGIVQDKTKITHRSSAFKTTKEIEKKERDGIVARTAENGISDSGNGADERKINCGANQLSKAARNGSVIVDGDEFSSEFVVGKPTSLFLGKRLGITAIDKFIAFEQLFDKMSGSDANVFAHVKRSGVSRECELPSKRLPGSPFLLVKTSPATLFPKKHIETLVQTSYFNLPLLPYLKDERRKCPGKNALNSKIFFWINPGRSIGKENWGFGEEKGSWPLGAASFGKWVETEGSQNANYCQYCTKSS
jgi:hypothetical protein